MSKASVKAAVENISTESQACNALIKKTKDLGAKVNNFLHRSKDGQLWEITVREFNPNRNKL